MVRNIKVKLIENNHFNFLFVIEVVLFKKVVIQLKEVTENKILVDINNVKKDNFIDKKVDEQDNFPISVLVLKVKEIDRKDN